MIRTKSEAAAASRRLVNIITINVFAVASIQIYLFLAEGGSDQSIIAGGMWTTTQQTSHRPAGRSKSMRTIEEAKSQSEAWRRSAVWVPRGRSREFLKILH